VPKGQQKKKGEKKLGGQPGHKGHSRFLSEPEECQKIFDRHRILDFRFWILD